jgi:predicted permease
MGNLGSDIRLALRGFRRSPLFAGVAVLSLALGIGANTAIFTLVDQILLRKLPVREPGQLVMLYQMGPHMGSNMGGRMHSYPMYQDIQKKAEPLSEVMCRRIVSASLSAGNETERVDAELVSGNYFTMLGVKPALGRVFNSQEDDQVYQGHPVVVLSYDYWARRFASDPSVIGRKIRVNDSPMTIVGVSAAGFSGMDPAGSPQIRVPIQMKPVLMPEQAWIGVMDRRTRWVQVFGRLKPGYTPESAQPALQTLFLQLRSYEMTLPAASTWSAFMRERFMTGSLRLESAAIGYSGIRNDFSKALVALMCMVGLVLLIACANVANLMIARASMRQKEIAVRMSLGASRLRLAKQWLTESAVLSVLGGALGVGVAVLLTRALLGLVPAGDQPLLLSARPDLRILAFSLTLTCLTALIFGLLPAWRASRPQPWTTLKDTVGSIAGSGGSLFLRKGLVVAQVALSFLLLFGAGLFVRSLQNLKGTSTGMVLENLLAFQVAPALNGYSEDRGTQFYQALLDRVRSAPGVKSAGSAVVSLLSGSEWDSYMSVEGHKAADGEDMQAFMNAVSPDYFKTMQIPVLEGRDFNRLDIPQKAPPPGEPAWTTVIVNQKFAKHFFPGRSAMGKHVGFGGGPNTRLNMEIVGVVADSLYEGPREGVRRQVFVPGGWGKGTSTIYVRTAMSSETTFAQIRADVKALDPALPVFGMKTVQGQLDETLLSDRLTAMLSAGFGLLATLLASIGLYGVMAFVVVRRTKEIGVRLALGAQPGLVVWLVMREVLVLLVVGLAVGVPAALATAKYVATLLYGIQPRDPAMAIGTVAVLALVSLAAGLIPATKASRIDPILALRCE